MMSRIKALELLYPYIESLPVISTCGATSRELASLGRMPNHYYIVDSMGLAPSIAIGVSLAIEEKGFQKCIAIEGDGGILMNPNALASARFLEPSKWLLIVLDNECFGSTGGQRSLAGKINIADVAKGYGLKVLSADDEQSLAQSIETALKCQEPIVIHVKIIPGNIASDFINDDPAVLSYKFSNFLTAAVH